MVSYDLISYVVFIISIIVTMTILIVWLSFRNTENLKGNMKKGWPLLFPEVVS